MGLSILRPESHVCVFWIWTSVFVADKVMFFRNKAVSDGAISFYLDHFVRTRVAKLTYGKVCDTPYNADLPGHRARVSTVYATLSGDRLVPNAFDVILPKVLLYIQCSTAQGLTLGFSNRTLKYQKWKNFEGRIIRPGTQMNFWSLWSQAVVRLFGVTEALLQIPDG